MLVPAQLAGVEDHRADFRHLFCAVNEQSADTQAGYTPCDELLVRFAGEPPVASAPPVSPIEPARTHVAVVRGLGWECMEGFIDARLLPTRHLERLGYQVTEIRVDGLSGSGRNAEILRDALQAILEGRREQRLLLMGHSKGVVDILESLTAYPEVAARVAAVISIAGSVGGSPLADEVPSGVLALAPAMPGTRCENGDGEALESLKPIVRQQWLATHRLPGGVRYYALAAAPEPARVSLAMRASQRRLSQIDVRNDGALLPQDQLIPGGVLLGYVNADHWAVALPIAASNRLLGSTVVNHNEFPRDALWEALVRYVDWDLSRRGPRGATVDSDR